MERGTSSGNSLATVVSDLAAGGCRRLLVTSSARGDGTSSVVARAGRALAGAERESVLLLDADPQNPSLRQAFGLSSRRGLAELLDEVFLLDPAREDPLQFGLGDWLALLRAQRRSGELEMKDGDDTWTLRIVRGSVYSIAGPANVASKRLGDILVGHGKLTAAQNEEAVRIHQESGRPLGEVLRALAWVEPAAVAAALDEQVRGRLTALLAMALPRGRLVELLEPHRPAAGGRGIADGDGVIDGLVFGSMYEYFKRPYLASQIPSYFADTDLPFLKVLTAGQREVDLHSPRHKEAFALLLQYLGRIFDLVLVDAPPVERGGPTAALAGLADGVLVVVRSNATDAPAIRLAIDELRRGDANVLGLLLNEAAADEPGALSWEVFSHDHAHPA
jgi:Mrp family chromosome partitioning ATPase